MLVEHGHATAGGKTSCVLVANVSQVLPLHTAQLLLCPLSSSVREVLYDATQSSMDVYVALEPPSEHDATRSHQSILDQIKAWRWPGQGRYHRRSFPSGIAGTPARPEHVRMARNVRFIPNPRKPLFRV